MMMHIFADWGNTGQNMVESIENTTISTTKAHGGLARIVGIFLSSNLLLSDGRYTRV